MKTLALSLAVFAASLSPSTEPRAQNADEAQLHRQRAILFYRVRVARDGVVLQNLKTINQLANDVIERQKEAIAEDQKAINEDIKALASITGSIVQVSAKIAQAKAARNQTAVQVMEPVLRALKQSHRDVTTQLNEAKKAKGRDEQVLAQAKKTLVDSASAVPAAAINLSMDQATLKRLESGN